MNKSPPPSAPLDDAEQSLARIVRALPAGEPSPALDARILKAATDALAAPPRRRMAWLATTGPLWSIGSAAAAVLAIAVAWHQMNPPRPSLGPSAPATLERDHRDEPGLQVEFKDVPPPPVDSAPPPPPPPPPAAKPSAGPAAAAQRAAPAAPTAPTALAAKPAPYAGLDEHVGNAAGIEAKGFPAEPKAVASQAPASTRTEAAPARDAAAVAPATAELAQARHEAEIALQRRVQPDARRYPESWLLKIRQRQRDGDIDGARASLQLYRRTYPDHEIPEDLMPLLRQ